MGFRSAWNWVNEKVYPAPIAPFVEVIAKALRENPGDFNIIFDPEAKTLKVRLAENPSSDIDPQLAGCGGGVNVTWGDGVRGKVFIVTHFYDDVSLNWREERLILMVLNEAMDAYEDARTLWALKAFGASE